MPALIRLVAVAACAIVALGFLAFAADESQKGSEAQVGKIATGNNTVDPTPREEEAREAENGPVREAIDDGSEALLSPFAGVVESENVWVTHLVPTVLALLVYGVLLMLLANYLPQPRRDTRDWREAY